MSVKGYMPGGGRSFTPSSDAKWTDDFNQLLEEYNRTHKYSRNRLTEKCVELGIQSLKQGKQTKQEINNEHSGVFIPLEGISEEQRRFIESREGINAISGIIKMLLLGTLNGLPVEATSTLENKKDTHQNDETDNFQVNSNEHTNIPQNNVAATIELEDDTDTEEDVMEQLMEKTSLYGGHTF